MRIFKHNGQKDKEKCFVCGKKTLLQTHHICYNPEVTIKVCKKHHGMMHGKKSAGGFGKKEKVEKEVKNIKQAKKPSLFLGYVDSKQDSIPLKKSIIRILGMGQGKRIYMVFFNKDEQIISYKYVGTVK